MSGKGGKGVSGRGGKGGKSGVLDNIFERLENIDKDEEKEHIALETKVDKIYEVVLDIQKEIASLKSAEHRGGGRRHTRRRKRRT